MKASGVFVSILSVVFIGALSLIIVQPAVADLVTVPTITIQDNATGGDCYTLGKWSANTKTCKLTKDIDVSGTGGDAITIAGDGITLLCNGHSITGAQGFWGIAVVGRSGVTIKYCKVHDVEVGIMLLDGGYNTVKSNTMYQNSVGIGVHSSFNTVNNNTAYSNGKGIDLDSADSNVVNNNTAYWNDIGISLDSADANNVNNNTAHSNGTGIYLISADSNTVNNNIADDNSMYGYSCQDSTGNTFKKSECSNNSLGGSYPTGLCSPQQ